MNKYINKVYYRDQHKTPCVYSQSILPSSNFVLCF